MLKLLGRGKKSVRSASLFSPYRNIFGNIKSEREVRREIKKQVSPSVFSFGNKVEGSIKLEGVEKRFGKKVVLKNLSFEIPKGKIFGIIGVSGSGKTTLLRLVVGYYKPTKGLVTFNQKDLQKQILQAARHFGFASQENSFYEDLTTEENVRFFGKLYGLKKEILNSRVEEVLKVVGLYEDGRVLAKNLSGGMKRRLDLACALVNDPSVLILDEPTEDLDPILRRDLLELIKRINGMGTTVIFTTHLLNEAEYLCHEVAILSKQGILTIGTPDDLRRMYKKGEEIHLVLEDTSNYKRYLRKLEGFKTVVVNGKLVVYVPVREQAPKLLRRILSMAEKNRDKIVYTDIRKPSLGEIFTQMIQDVKEKNGKKRG
ncbi:MAG: ABC transporter ATP-binding protein [Candidatus Woesearchaeota archaeon]